MSTLLLATDNIRPRRHALKRWLLPRGVLELGEVKQGEQEVLIQLDRHALQQDRRVLDEPDSVGYMSVKVKLIALKPTSIFEHCH
jgi:hypothetical protein